MKFHFQVRTKEGEIKAGVVEASSEEAAVEILQKYGFYVTYLKEVKPSFYTKRFEPLQRLSQKDIVLFTRQLAIMCGSKVPLVEALKTLSLSDQTTNFDLREKIIDISEKIEAGNPLSKALSFYPKVFSPVYVSMVKAGEASGRLAESLNYLADHLERDYNLRARIKGALVYPALILSLIFVALIFLTFNFIPNLKTIVEATNVQLPRITRGVIAVSEFLRKFWYLVLVGIFLFFWAIFRFYKTPQGKELFDRIFLRAPLLGSILKTFYISQFAENLSTLISGGLMITQALELTANVMGNSTYKKAILSAQDEVKKGVPISSVLALYSDIFPPIFVQMTLVGEKSGTLDSTLMKVAEFYRKEGERKIESSLSLLEPFLIVMLGLMMGGLILSVLLPLYQSLSVAG